MDEKRIEKKGQATIWVIVAISLVAVIILLFIFRGKVVKTDLIDSVEENPGSFIDNCARNAVNEVVDIILPKGGFVNPSHTKMHKGENISYLCFNAGNYNPCINEHPLYLTEIKREVETYITPKIEECFETYKLEMEKRGSIVEIGIMDVDVELVPDRVFVLIQRKVNIESREQSYSYNNFDVEIISPLYNLGRIGAEIASQEAEYCYFEYVGYMILYPKFKIGRDITSDSTKIYSIKDKKSGKELKIAIRSCAIPPGF
ncbi:MAG: hypothetical protein Q7S27_06960 [Nanoarchaeota archaeon]|nr:hypothetical protein [Nanoarchaeota archaeon]